MKFTRLSVGVVGALALLGAACGSDEQLRRHRPGTTAAPTTEATATSAGDRDVRRRRGGGGDFSSIFLPKCTGNAVFDQANEGAKEAATELGVTEADFVGPASCADSTGQIEFVTNAVTQGVDAIMISNNAGDQIDPAIKAAADAGITVVSWDSPIPSGEGEDLFVAQVDFDETGKVMADMALDDPRRRGRRAGDPLGDARRGQPERLDQVVQRGAQGSEVRIARSSSTRCTATTTPTSPTTRRCP